MAAKKKAAKAGAAAMALKNSQYVQRIAEDDELRANLIQAYESSRSAANRLSNGKSPATAVFDDKRLQRDISQAAVALRDAAVALRGKPKRKRKGGLRRLLLLALIGTGVALAVSEGLRKKVLDTLFGAEEEFEYSSTTTTTTTAPPAPAPAAAG